MLRKNKVWGLAFTLAGALALLIAMFAVSKPQTVRAQPADMNSAVAKYPNISGSSLQSCDLCHAGSPPDLNPFGADYLANGRSTSSFGLIENIDSDGDGFTNIQEFRALTFPGDPTSFPVLATATFTTVPPTPTATFTSVPPTATATFTTVPATPTATFTTVPATPTATFTLVPPTATATFTSVPPTATATFTTVPGTPTATFTSIPPTATATITATPPTVTATVTTTPGLDLDIHKFKVTSEVKLKEVKPIKIRLEIQNSGSVNGQGIATVVGIQNGIEMYRVSMSVSDSVGGKFSEVSFPSYTPTVSGKIKWTVTLIDNNPDSDVKYATTKVESKHKHKHHDDDKYIPYQIYE